MNMSINNPNKEEDNEEENIRLEKFTSSEFSEETPDKNNDYIKDVFMKNIRKNIFILAIVFIFFISEFFFRKPLFEYSKTFEKKWQKSASEGTIIFFKIITKVCGEYLMGAPIAFVLCFFPMVKSSFYIAGLIFDLHFHSLMKIWYGNSRPYWEDPELFKDICDGGFGNPSGHSISSVYLYSALYIYLYETKMLENKNIIKIILLLLFITYALLVVLSRLILGIHSINQILYGSVLGLFTTLLICQIFKLHKMPISFYKKLFKEKLYIFCISSILIVLALFSIVSCASFNRNFDYEHTNQNLPEKCRNLPEYRKYNNDGLFGAFVVFALLGMYLGQVIFWYLIDNQYKKEIKVNKKIESLKSSDTISDISKDDYDEKKNDKLIDDLINNWNENRTYININMTKLLKLTVFLLICCIPLIFFLFISKTANIVVIFIFKIAIPFFSTLFLIYSLGFYYIIKILCGEKDELLNKVDDQNIDTSLV